MEELQEAIQEAVKQIQDMDIDKANNKPIYEFVATYDGDILTKYIGG